MRRNDRRAVGRRVTRMRRGYGRGVRSGLVGRDVELERARALVTSGVGVLFAGEPGVGKTRLLAETLDSLSEREWHTERFVASAGTRRVAFGPLISLLPADAADRTQQLAGVRRTLTERAKGRRTVLAVDDAHLLDDASLACLIDLAHHSDVVLLATARSTEPVPPDLTALWASEIITRVDVEPLSRAATAALVGLLLGGTILDDLIDRVWERTRGVPLFVRELLLDAATQHTLTQRDDAWSVHGELGTGARLQELVGARTATLSAPAKALLDLLAIGEPVAVGLLTADEGVELDVLEQLGLARAEQLAGQWVARVDHPLITDAVIAALPTRQRLHLTRDLADRLVTAGCRAPGDALRAAAWYEDCGDTPPAPVALAAGREALASLALDRAGELAQLTLEELPRQGHLLLGEALRLQGRAVEAEEALAVAAELADDDETIVRVAMWRSTLLSHHADDPNGAVALLNTAADRVTAAERALELRSEAAFLAGILGRFDVAVDTNRRIIASPGLDTPTRWTAMMNLLFGQVMLADLTCIDEPIEAMAELIDEIAPTRPEGIDLYWALVASVATWRGDLDRCETRFVAHVQQCLATEQLHGVTAAILVYPLLYRGSAHIMTMTQAACAATAQSDPYLVGPIAHAGHTIAHANAGDLDRARAALADVDVSHTGDLRLAGFIGRARAAVLALEGRYDAAAEVVAAAGRDCVAGTYLNFGALSLYDAVRYGHAGLVADDLAGLADCASAPLINAMAAHAAAQRTGDATALTTVAGAFATMGARTLVAEALDDAARAAPGDIAAGRASTTAALWRRATPVINARARPVDGPLSERELDVVEQAILGESSRAIAETLFVSIRTVDNHLAQVYRKLDVGGRTELADALGPMPPAA